MAGLEDNAPGIDFCTLGMFIIDEIHFQPPKSPVNDILGGAGTYSALGARIFSPPPLSKSVGWIVDVGHDFPQVLRNKIDTWQTNCLLRETPWRKTTRGWNGYGDNEHRAFRYTTEKMRLDQDSLDDDLLKSKSFHLICSPLRCIDLISRICERRKAVDASLSPALWIWEPVPDLCTPEELLNCKQALQMIDVISPNHSELCGFFGEEPHNGGGGVNVKAVEKCCKELLDQGIGANERGCVIVRCGKEGCYVANRAEGSRWIPAYHETKEKVSDPTGGGNAFLGGMAVALSRQSRDTQQTLTGICEAAIAGNVAASFAIEQVGMPEMSSDADGNELWNDDSVIRRLEALETRVA